MSRQLLLQFTPVMYRSLLRELLRESGRLPATSSFPLEEVYYFSQTGEGRFETHALAGDLCRLGKTRGIAVLDVSETEMWMEEMISRERVPRRVFRRVGRSNSWRPEEDWSEEEAFARSIASRCQTRVGILAQPYQILRAFTGMVTVLAERGWHQGIRLYALTPPVPDVQEHPSLTDLVQEEMERFIQAVCERGYSPPLALEYLGQRYRQDEEDRKQAS